MKELEIKTKYGIRKIQLEESESTSECSQCSYKGVCMHLIGFSRLEIPVSKNYSEDYSEDTETAKNYRDFDSFCTYEIPIGYRPVNGTLEQNLIELFPDAAITDINNFCDKFCIVSGEVTCLSCPLKKWINI